MLSQASVSKDRVDRTCRLLKRRYLFVLFCSVFLPGLPRAADQNICKQSWAAQAQLCYRKCLFPAKTDIVVSIVCMSYLHGLWTTSTTEFQLANSEEEECRAIDGSRCVFPYISGGLSLNFCERNQSSVSFCETEAQTYLECSPSCNEKSIWLLTVV